MCGRFAIHSSMGELARLFGIEGGELPSFAPRYNIAPTTEIPVVRHDPNTQQRVLDLLTWSFRPTWAKTDYDGPTPINARAETVARNNLFRHAFARSRCLIPADVFYEWQPGSGGKQPWAMARPDRAPMALAGIWADSRLDAERRYRGCAIIVTRANAALAPIHGRMPVILPPEHWDVWLDPGIDDTDALTELLQPAPDDAVEAWRISRRVNSPRNDEPSLLDPDD